MQINRPFSFADSVADNVSPNKLSEHELSMKAIHRRSKISVYHSCQDGHKEAVADADEASLYVQ